MAIRGSTRIFGVLGWPVEHSRSPQMHNAAIAQTGVDAVYVPFPVRPERLPEAVGGLAALGIDGANVTLPHKERVLSLLDRVEPQARAIGAVNTLVREGSAWVGANTDAEGLVRSLAQAGVEVRGRNVTVIGAGGAARASVVGLADAGAHVIAVAARRLARAQQLLEELGPAADCGEAKAVDLASSLGETLERTRLLVQATSATLGDTEAADAFARSLPLDCLPRDAVVTDLVYDPRRTAVLRAAESHGLQTVDGLGMLVHQGALAFERWTRHPAPVDVMRHALE